MKIESQYQELHLEASQFFPCKTRKAIYLPTSVQRKQTVFHVEQQNPGRTKKNVWQSSMGASRRVQADETEQFLLKRS